ncbi:hypothetical protein NQ318_013321 [Aromia moschata]|uniref:Uncharacterized protein n=1 Tax=Aromia moschata TaxID=1265417 RepID=A0AAV8Y0Y0_9CUCU|nr:hypothetical protein NQ318_013321 [Aromia moschata]
MAAIDVNWELFEYKLCFKYSSLPIVQSPMVRNARWSDALILKRSCPSGNQKQSRTGSKYFGAVLD